MVDFASLAEDIRAQLLPLPDYGKSMMAWIMQTPGRPLNGKRNMNYFDIFSESDRPFADFKESYSYLETMRDRYGVLNLSYWYLTSLNTKADRVTWLSTYPKDYQQEYLRDYSPSGDPAFNASFARPIPVDWSDLRDMDQSVTSIQKTAASYGIGMQGISFPIRDPGFGLALFSVNFSCPDEDWQDIRGRLSNIFHIFAHFYHLRIKDLLSIGLQAAEAELSPREREVLRYAADGKTAWETARLLNLTERTVQQYTRNAMAKMQAHTKTQAVALAMKRRMLD